jgi:ATP-dependent Lon protease
VLPLKNTVLFPHLLSPLLVNTDRSRRLIDEVLRSPERLLVCVAVNRPVESSPGPDDLHRVGTVMRIAKMLKFPDDSYRLLVQGVSRVRIEGFVSESPYHDRRIHRLVDTGDPRPSRPRR